MEDVLASSGPPRRAVSTSSGGGAAGGASAGAPSSAGPSGADAANASGAVGPPSAINTVALPPKPQFPALSGKALPVCCGCNLFGNSATSVSCDWTPYFSSLPCVLVILTLSLVCWLFVPRLWVMFSSRRLYLLWCMDYSVAARASARSPSPLTATPLYRPSGCLYTSRWCSSSSCRCG